jgi:hypothetical protein
MAWLEAVWADWLTSPNGTSLFHLSDRSEEYKARKEAFVSGLSGSTMEDVAFALAPVPVSALRWRPGSGAWRPGGWGAVAVLAPRLHPSVV